MTDLNRDNRLQRRHRLLDLVIMKNRLQKRGQPITWFGWLVHIPAAHDLVHRDWVWICNFRSMEGRLLPSALFVKINVDNPSFGRDVMG